MNKARWNLLLDGILALAMLAEVVSGFVLWLVLPHAGGYRGGRGLEVAKQFIFERSVWLTLHDWGAVVLTAGILLHIFLHRKWIACMFGNLWRNAKDAARTRRTANAQVAAQDCPN
ncbi:MAG: DUF4405 domain-containing protein [Chloroflexi bacterium]|nr:DUF4405 domain-containing protein [Chloroflexota bacterium]